MGFDEKREKIVWAYKEKEDFVKNGQKKYHRVHPMTSGAVWAKEKFAFAKEGQQGREGRA